jgi:hypothetical protein
MKKIILIALALTFYFTDLKACDICGCGVGDSYIGILPDFSKHILGLRLRYNSILTHVGVGGSTSYLTTKENYRTIELWSGWNIGSRFRLMWAVPYSFNERLNQGVKKSKDGLGDINLAGYYQVLNSRKTVGSKLMVQSLWLGAGVKLPTGKYNPFDKANTNESANLFQLGTASTDFTVNAMYDLRLQDAGISVSGSYKINTVNKHDYRYGNKLSLATQLYYKWRILNTMTVAPNAGIMFEKARRDNDNSFDVDISGGNMLLGTLGTEVTFKKFSVGANFQTPLAQNLAMGIIKAQNRGMVHVSFLL